MASRSRSRQFALQLLFQKEFAQETPQALAHFWEENATDEVTKTFCQELMAGVEQHSQSLDMEISAYLKNWSLNRIAKMDKLILRIAFYELTVAKKVPWKVVIDEAIMLAKLFSTDKSPTFINGVLHAWSTQNGFADSDADQATQKS